MVKRARESKPQIKYAAVLPAAALQGTALRYACCGGRDIHAYAGRVLSLLQVDMLFVAIT